MLCLSIVQPCLRCQIMSTLPRKASTALQIISSPWPFAIWGVDIIGPMPVVSRQCQFLLVAVDYLTKWVEAKPPYAAITSKKVIDLLWKEIITRFGIPKAIVSGSQFDSQDLRDFCVKNKIEQRFTSVRAPWSNGQVQRK